VALGAATRGPHQQLLLEHAPYKGARLESLLPPAASSGAFDGRAPLGDRV
jgi:hypothetical protein